MAASIVEVFIKWDVQEVYILRYLLHCHEESESYTTPESRCFASGLEKLIREPQSAQKTIDNGQIAQQGTHEELLKQPGIYQDFVNIRKSAAGWSLA